MNTSAQSAAQQTSRATASLRVLARVPQMDDVRRVAPDPPASDPQPVEAVSPPAATAAPHRPEPVAQPEAGSSGNACDASTAQESTRVWLASIERWRIDPKQLALGVAAAAAVFVLLINTHGRRSSPNPAGSESVVVAPTPPEIALPEPTTEPMLPSLGGEAGPSLTANEPSPAAAPAAETPVENWAPVEPAATDQGSAVAAANSGYDLSRQPGITAPVAEVTTPVARVTARPEGTPSESWGGDATGGGMATAPAATNIAAPQMPPQWAPPADPGASAPPPANVPAYGVPGTGSVPSSSGDSKVKRIRNPYQAQARIPRPPLPTAEPTQPAPTGGELPVYRVAERPEGYSAPATPGSGARIEGVRPVQPQVDGTQQVGAAPASVEGGRP